EFAKTIPFLNTEAYNSSMFLILVFFGCIVIKESLKLFFGKWTPTLVIYTAIINMISFIIIMFLMTRSHVWNPNFMNELVQENFVTKGSDAYQTINAIWENFTLWILIFLVIGLIWDIVAGFIKARKST